MHGALFSQMVPPVDLEAEFHDWYDSEHVPVRMRLPGFARAVRYEAIGPGTKYAVCYFLDDLGVLSSPEYDDIKRNPGERTQTMLGAVSGFTRYTAELMHDSAGSGASAGFPAAGGPTVVHALRFDPDDSRRAGSYATAARGLDPDSWLRVRIFEPFGDSVGTPWTHLAVHDLAATADVGDVIAGPPVELSGVSGLLEQAWWVYRTLGSFDSTAT